MLTNPEEMNEETIEEEIKKCSELIEYKNSKINTIDNSRKLLDEFSNLPSAMSVHLATMVPELSKLFDSLPIKVKKFSTNEPKPEQISYEFSKTKKLYI